MKRTILALALCLVSCSAPRYQGKVTVEGVSLGVTEAQLALSGWKVGADGKGWSRPDRPKQLIFLEFSPDRKVTRVRGGALLDERGKSLVSFGQSTGEVEKTLGSPNQWKKPDRPPGQSDPPALNQMIYSELKLVVDNDAREQTVDHVTLSEKP